MTRRSLNEKRVLALTSNGLAQADHFDADCAGLSLRVTKAGKKTWAFNYTSPRDGKRARYSLGTFPATTISDARDLAIAARRNVEKGKDPRDIEPEIAAKTVAELIEDRLAFGLKGKRSADRAKWRFEKYVTPLVGKIAVRDFQIDPHYNRVIDPLVKAGKHRTAGIIFQDLRALMNFAIQRGVIEYSRIARVKRPDQASARTRFLSEPEIVTVWHRLDTVLSRSDHTPTILKLCLLLGARLSEVAGMERDEIDLRSTLWTIPPDRSKNKFAHTLPLTGFALELISNAMRESNGDFLFPDRSRKRPTMHRIVDYALGKAQKPREGLPLGKFGIPHLTPHDLRRSVATHMSRMGISQIVIGHVLNHRTVTKASLTQQVYDQHDFADEKLAALQKWDAKIAALVSTSEAAEFEPVRQQRAVRA